MRLYIWKNHATDEYQLSTNTLKAWLRAKRVTAETTVMAAPAAVRHNALIGELLQEIEDAEKEGV